MPQLDILPYSSEIMWLVITFFTFYFILVRRSLPKLYRILQFRQKKIIFVSSYVTRSLKEKLNYSILIKGGTIFAITKVKEYLTFINFSTPDLFTFFFLPTLKSKRSWLILVLYAKTTMYGVMLEWYNYKMFNKITSQR